MTTFTAAAFAVVAVALVPSSALGQTTDVAKGKVTYQKYCASCHGSNGKGNGPVAALLNNPKPRDHTDGAFMENLSDAYLADIITRGGAAVGRSPLMPAGKTLTKEEIANLVAYLRALAR
ncbi:MAG: c-type cytochrome [Candidatus Binatia bacterium]